MFTDEIFNLLQSGQYNQVPVIIGTNSDEGALNAVGFIDGKYSDSGQVRANFDDLNDLWEDSLGPLILFHRSFDETTDEDRKMARNIKDLYFKNKDISKGL